MSLCPRGYFTALESYYPFPTYQALAHAKKICNGELPDINGIKKISNNNYISVKVPNVEGFTRRHAEGWINVCNNTPCVKDTSNPRCRPQYKYDNKTHTLASDADLDTICNVNIRRFVNIDILYSSLLKGGVVPFGQVVYKNKSIGILDTDKHFHICKPSTPLTTVNTIELQSS